MLNKSISSAGDRTSALLSGQLGRDWGTGAFFNSIVELRPGAGCATSRYEPKVMYVKAKLVE